MEVGGGRLDVEAAVRETEVASSPSASSMNETRRRTAMHDAFLGILPSAGCSPEIPAADDLYGWLIGSWNWRHRLR